MKKQLLSCQQLVCIMFLDCCVIDFPNTITKKTMRNNQVAVNYNVFRQFETICQHKKKSTKLDIDMITYKDCYAY